MSKQAQISMEYLLITGIILAILLPIFYYSISTTTQSLKMNQANELVKTVASTADVLYFLGSGSQETVTVVIPGGTESIVLSGKEVVLKLKIFGSVSDITASTKGNVTGSIPLQAGARHITLKNENNVIKITG